MAVVMLPLDATAGSPAFTAQETRQAFSSFMGTAPSGRPLGAISGVRPGTPTTTVFLSGGGSTTWNVATHSGVLDTQTAAAAGPYAYATDGSDSGAITAANGSNPRVDIIYVKVNDDAQDGSGLTSGQVLYLAGTAASSPSPPAVPARGMVLANINVPTSGGGAPTVSWVAPTFGVASATPAFIVERAAFQNMSTGTEATISFDTEVLDTDGMFTATSTDITVQTAGLWRLTARLGFDNNTTALRTGLIYVNGSLVHREDRPAAPSSSEWAMTTTYEVPLAAGDVLNLHQYQNSGGNLATGTAPSTTTRFSGVWQSA